MRVLVASARLLAKITAAAALLSLSSVANAQSTPGVAHRAARLPLPVPGKDGLYQRIVVRPGALRSENPAASPANVPVAGFSVFYVYDRQTVGAETWVEVGDSLNGRTEGWIEGSKAIEWKHNLVLAFNNPAGRDRAMFFENAEAPRQLWAAENRAAAAARYRNDAAGANPGPVIALEPDTYVDITKQFYFLPVLGAEQLTAGPNQRARLLEVISAPAPASGVPLSDADALRNFKGVVVFVVDTTVSMGPYIEQAKEVVKRVVARLGSTELASNFRFGLIAYRDHMGGNAALEYVTRPAYLPNFTEPPEKVLDSLGAVQEARANNQDFDEDAVAGLKLALDKVNWQDFAGRYMILITDAGTRDANDRLSETHLGIAEIKALARSEAKQVSIFAVHLKTPEGVANHARAERQYTELTENSGKYIPIAVGNPAEFRQTIDLLADGLLASVGQTVGRPIAAPTAQTEMGRQILRQVQVVSSAMRLSYLGRTRAQGVPDMVRSFVLDEDPSDPVPARKPLDVRVLLTKNQLSDLAKTVKTIVDAANANRMSPENFFSQVRAASIAASRDPQRMNESQRLSGAFAAFLKDLPYESPVMEITPEQWKDEMAPSERRELINALDAKLRLYEELNSESSLWVGFDGRQGTGESFYPVPIDQLP